MDWCADDHYGMDIQMSEQPAQEIKLVSHEDQIKFMNSVASYVKAQDKLNTSLNERSNDLRKSLFFLKMLFFGMVALLAIIVSQLVSKGVI